MSRESIIESLRRRVMDATFAIVEGGAVDRGVLADLLIEVDKLFAGAVPVVKMGGLTPAYYPAGDGEPDAYLLPLPTTLSEDT